MASSTGAICLASVGQQRSCNLGLGLLINPNQIPSDGMLTSPGWAMPAPQETDSLLKLVQGEAGTLQQGAAAAALLLSLRLRDRLADGKSLPLCAGRVRTPCAEAGTWRPLECSLARTEYCVRPARGEASAPARTAIMTLLIPRLLLCIRWAWMER